MNASENWEYVINLLQCRPLQVFKSTGTVEVPEGTEKEKILLESTGSSMGLSRELALDMIVYVDPAAYYNLPYAEKPKVARLIGSINWQFREQDKRMLLFVPGRIGTSSPELGVPAAFSDISGFDVICEVAERSAGYNPELSYGSHIFQDLVEAQILYSAVFPENPDVSWHPERLKGLDNQIASIPGGEELEHVITLADVSHLSCRLYYNLEQEHLLIAMDDISG